MRDLLSGDCFEPQVLIHHFKRDPVLKDLFESRVGLTLPFTLEDHTLAAMREFEKYFASRITPEHQAERGILRAALALHDIGKPEAILQGDKKLQHHHTLRILHELKNRWDFVREELHLLAALLAGDPIGGYLADRQELAASVEQVRHHAGKSLQAPFAYWRMLVVYYQCDVAAYTSSAGILPTLDGVFEWETLGLAPVIRFDREAGRLVFSERVRPRFERLECEVTLQLEKRR